MGIVLVNIDWNVVPTSLFLFYLFFRTDSFSLFSRFKRAGFGTTRKNAPTWRFLCALALTGIRGGAARRGARADPGAFPLSPHSPPKTTDKTLILHYINLKKLQQSVAPHKNLKLPLSPVAFFLPARVHPLIQTSRAAPGLTCWPFDAVGVDLNRQDQQKCAGVHRVGVLVHFR